jgi:hypothetical protein
VWILAVIILVGAGLRLYSIHDQLLLDDEWHKLELTCRTPLSELLTNYYPGSNSIPINVYIRILFVTVGWSEFGLVLPSVACGLLLLCLIPRLAGRMGGPSTTVFAAALAAASPLLIYYSRICRSYGPYMLLSCLLAHAAYMWVTDGRRRYGYLTAIWGALLVYVHQLGVLATFPTFAAVCISRLVHQSSEKSQLRWPAPPWKDILLAGYMHSLLLCLLIGPAILNSLGSLSNYYSDGDRFGATTLLGTGQLMAGSESLMFAFAWWGLCLFGLIGLIRCSRFSGLLVILGLAAHVVFLYAHGAPELSTPIVLVRYTTAMIPLFLVCAGKGLADLMEAFIHRFGRPALQPAGLLVLVIVIAVGPVPHSYTASRNFTNHAQFQETARVDLTRMYSSPMRLLSVVTLDDVPDFYRELKDAPDDTAIVEFPFMLGHSFQTSAFYQTVHGKRVFGGYVWRPSWMRNVPNLIVIRSFHTAGNVLSRLPPEANRWRNLVNLENLAPAVENGARYLVIHIRPVSEAVGAESLTPLEIIPELDHHFLADTAIRCRQVYGAPVFRDSRIVVFDLTRSAVSPRLADWNRAAERHTALKTARVHGVEAGMTALREIATRSETDAPGRLLMGQALLDQKDHAGAKAQFELAIDDAIREWNLLIRQPDAPPSSREERLRLDYVAFMASRSLADLNAETKLAGTDE